MAFVCEAMSRHVYTYYDPLKATIPTSRSFVKNALHQSCSNCDIRNNFGTVIFPHYTEMFSSYNQGQMQSTRTKTKRSNAYDARNKIFEHNHGAKTSEIFLIIGVMTADRYISTRVKTIRETWANTLDSVKIIFFCGDQGNASMDFDFIRLPGVDDTYPPQNKSFYMLKYIFEHYINEFHWFVRADDDAYIRSDRLSELLRRFDSSEDLMFGQAGVGKLHEKGKLGLEDSDNFCIGGVGVVMSQSVVRKVAPYLLTCLNQTVSLHEDSELGRCIRRHVGVMCPWGQEVVKNLK